MLKIEDLLSNIRDSSSNINSFSRTLKSKKYKSVYTDIEKYLKSLYNIDTNNIQLYINLYYHNYPLNYTIPKCICGKSLIYKKGLIFNKTCGSPECNKKQHEITNIKRYGVSVPSKSEEIKEKVKQTNLKKYGCESYNQSNITKEKKKQTYIKHYGVEHYSKTNEYKEKVKKVAIEKYNVNSFLNAKKIRDKIKQTNMKRYGVENVFSSNIIKDKIKQTNLKRYGVENVFSSNIIKDKIKQTNIIRYNTENPIRNDDVKLKIKNNYKNKKIERYKNIIKNKNIDIELLNDKLLCNKCKNVFSIDNPILKERFLYYYNIICPFCYPSNKLTNSNIQKEILNFIKELLPNEEIIENSRILEGKEIDIYILSKSTGFEINGLYWHSELYKDKYYHRDKSKLASEKGIRLIHIWEDDWNYKQEIVKSRIRNILNKTENRIYARNTIISNITYQDCKQFLNENHIQGCGVGNVKYGLYFNKELVSVIQIDSSGQLSRFANKLNTNIIGGFSKLFKYCEKHIKYTFIDLDWSSENNIYSRYMKFDSYIEPTWYLIYEGRRVHRRNFQKKKLLQMGLGSPEQTEHEITLSNKLYRIYNSGNIKYSNI